MTFSRSRKSWQPKIPKPLSEGEETLAMHLHDLKPVREYRFHPERKWRFDFAFPDRMIAVEVEGGVYSKGRHTRPKGYKADVEKYNAAAALGWTVLRFTTDMVRSGSANATVREVLG